jgi:hypothetical protein
MLEAFLIFLLLGFAFIGLVVTGLAAFIVFFNWYCNSRFNSLNKRD